MDKELIEWIKRSLECLKYGQVTLIIHDGQVVRIDRKERIQVK